MPELTKMSTPKQPHHADINAIKLTVSATGIDKDYDGDNIATVTLSTDALAGDKVTADYTGATFDNKNVGTDKPVSVQPESQSAVTIPETTKMSTPKQPHQRTSTRSN